MDQEIRKSEREAHLRGGLEERRLEALKERVDARDPWAFEIGDSEDRISEDRLIIDPEMRTVASHDLSYGTPTSIRHKTKVWVEVPGEASQASILEVLNGSIKDLDQIASKFNGAEWNGSNHDGSWSDGIEELLEEFAQLFHDLPVHYKASEYFESVEIGQIMASGVDVKVAANKERGQDGTILDEGDVRDHFVWIAEQRIEELESDIEDLSHEEDSQEIEEMVQEVAEIRKWLTVEDDRG